MKKICILSRHSTLAASSRLRTFQYMEHLNGNGYQVDVFPFFDEQYLRELYSSKTRTVITILGAYWRRFTVLFKTAHYDCLWIEKEVFPYLPGFIDRVVHLFKVPYIVDYDDAIFHTYDEHKYLFVRLMLGNKLRPLLKHSSAVTVGNRYLANYALRMGAKYVVEIPTVINIHKYALHNSSLGKSLRIGWIGTPQTTKYLKDIIDTLESLSTEIPLCLVLIGASDIGSVQFQVEYHQWAESTEAEILNTIDVGIMPLPDESWERGKCGYKLIQYMALAKPVIASPVGINIEILKNEVGFLASTPSEWKDALLRIYHSNTLRLKLASNARCLVESKYSLGVTAPRILDLFNEIIN